MHGNEVAGISQQVADLNVDNGRGNPGAYSVFETEPPPAPNPHSQGVIAMDVTGQFIDAAKMLDVGQLVKDPYFTLFEAVGALEIMDRKMDSGYLEPGETMEDDYDYTQPLLPEEVIGIIDQLLCHEMAWHMGYPLSQTIFTSLYIDRILTPSPLSIDHTYFDRSESCSDDEPLMLQTLRAYCLGLIKTCFFVNSRVKEEHFYEEEDFVTHTYNRTLLDSIEPQSILDFLDETAAALVADTNIPEDMKNALVSRLKFRTAFLETVELADSTTSTDLKSLWTTLAESCPFLRSSSKLGKPVPSSFSVKIQRKLASTVPPRPIVEVAQAAAYDHLERLCRDGVAVVEVLNYYDTHSLLTFIQLFQARKPQPSIYIRTLLQHYVFGDMIVLRSMSIRQILDEDVSSTVLPDHILLDRNNDEIEVTTDPRFNMATRMEVFRSRAAGVYLDVLRTICQNRCRIRRTLRHTIVAWDNLQFDCEELDQELREFTGEQPIIDPSISSDPIYSFPLSSWAYFYKLLQMEWFVQMGFELETYQPDEYALMYFYLQYLSRTRSRHLERMRGFVLRSQTTTGRATEAFATAIAFINFSTLEAATIYGFADALSYLYTIFGRLSLLPKLPRPYSTDAMRYDVRMKAFESVSLPELIAFDRLTKLVSAPHESTLDKLKFAAEAVAGAKKGFEILSKLSAEETFSQGCHESWKKNIQGCLKACIFTGITIASVRKAVEGAGKDGKVKLKVEIPTPEKGYHDWWVVPKVLPIS